MAYVILELTTGDTCGDNRIGLPFRWRVKESTLEIPLPDMEVVGLKFAEPIPITQGDIDNFPNEIRIERIGSCNKCGYCCGYVAKNTFSDHACIHLVKTGANKGECSIYDTLEDWCAICEDNHIECVPPPHQPYPKGICALRFIVTTAGLPITGKEVSRIFWAKEKDLTGKWIR